MRSLRKYCVPGLFVLVALIAFSNILNSYFLSDDFAQIGKVLGGDFSVTWGQAQGGFFRPLFILSYVIDTRIWGARPFGLHVTNVTVHALNSFLVFILSLQLVRELKLATRTKKAISIGAASLFLLHPSHTEAVSWISGRADLIATFFCLGSILFYLAYTKEARGLHLGLSLLCFTLALLAKESAICLPFLLLVIGLFLDKARSGKTVTKFLKVVALFGFVLLVFVVVRSFFIGALVGGYGVSQHLNFSPGWLRDRLLEASVRSVLPTLPEHWSLFLFKPLQSRLFILISLFSCGLVAAAIVFKRRWYDASERKDQNRIQLMLVALFLISLLPVINLRLSLYQTLGERFLYLPSVFSCLLMSYLMTILVRNAKAWILILICVLGFYSASLYQTNRLWSEAAYLSSSIKDDLVNSATRERLLVLNVPDNLRGVPVFHNGLPEALEYFQNQRPIKQVEIVALQNFHSAADGVELIRQGNSLMLNAANENDTFDRIAASECLEVTGHSPHTLHLEAKPCSPTADLFLFDKGRMNKLSHK